MAKYLIAQYGGPDGELAAALRYQTQRFVMPTGKAKAVLTDIATEELAHLEIIATLVFKLLKGVPVEILKREGLGNTIQNMIEAYSMQIQQECYGPPPISRLKEMQSLIHTKIWQPKKSKSNL